MFKNYLTYQFALSFERGCSVLNIPKKEKDGLIRCSSQVLNFFSKSLESQNRKEEAQNLFVALMYLRDCKAILDRVSIDPGVRKNIEFALGPYVVLKGRVEQLLSA